MSSEETGESEYESDEDVGFHPSDLFNSSPDGYGPLSILMSYLDIRTLTELAPLCSSYGRTVKQFFKLTEEASNILRPRGISLDEVKSLINPKTGAGEALFTRILHSHYVHNFKVSVEIDFNTYTLLEYACYRGYPVCVRMLLEKNFDRRYFNFGLEYGAYSGNLEVVKMLMSKPVSTVYVNKSLQRAIDRQFFDVAAFMISDFRVCLNYKSSAHIKSIFGSEGGKISKFMKMKKASTDAENKKLKEELAKVLIQRHRKMEEKRRKKEEKMSKRMSRTFKGFFSGKGKGKSESLREKIAKADQKNKSSKKNKKSKKSRKSKKDKKEKKVAKKEVPENAIVNTRYVSAKQHRVEEKKKKLDEKEKRREEKKRLKKIKKLEEEEREREIEDEKKRKLGKDDELDLFDGKDELMVIDGGGYDAGKAEEGEKEERGEREEEEEEEEDDGELIEEEDYEEEEEERGKKRRKRRIKEEVKIRYETQTVIEKKIVIEKKFEQVPIPVVDYDIAKKLKTIKKLQNEFIRDLNYLQDGLHDLSLMYDKTDEKMNKAERHVDQIHEIFPKSGKRSESEKWKNKRVQRVMNENRDLREENRELKNENHSLAKELRKQNNLVSKLRKTLKKISAGEAKRLSRRN